MKGQHIIFEGQQNHDMVGETGFGRVGNGIWNVAMRIVLRRLRISEDSTVWRNRRKNKYCAPGTWMLDRAETGRKVMFFLFGLSLVITELKTIFCAVGFGRLDGYKTRKLWRMWRNWKKDGWQNWKMRLRPGLIAETEEGADVATWRVELEFETENDGVQNWKRRFRPGWTVVKKEG